ncbi:hypothetical protein [Actinomadura fibrosa]|uniref:Uncharacterized protein n=1 Tax=Actinomadura fibrosa TaxID=111802 RepID=A0ABW2XPT8_9ACTN
MCPSRDVPPAGYTRAAPQPPRRKHALSARPGHRSHRPRRRPIRLKSSLPAVALAVALAGGIMLTVAYGTVSQPPGHGVAPDAVPSATAVPAPVAPPPPALPGSAAPAFGGEIGPPDGARPAERTATPAGTPPAAPPGRPGGQPAGRPSQGGTATHPRPVVTRNPRPRPIPRPRTRAPHHAPPATPAWVLAECRKRFPTDPARRHACAAALVGYFGR